MFQALVSCVLVRTLAAALWMSYGCVTCKHTVTIIQLAENKGMKRLFQVLFDYNSIHSSNIFQMVVGC